MKAAIQQQHPPTHSPANPTQPNPTQPNPTQQCSWSPCLSRRFCVPLPQHSAALAGNILLGTHRSGVYGDTRRVNPPARVLSSSPSATGMKTTFWGFAQNRVVPRFFSSPRERFVRVFVFPRTILSPRKTETRTFDKEKRDKGNDNDDDDKDKDSDSDSGAKQTYARAFRTIKNKMQTRKNTHTMCTSGVVRDGKRANNQVTDAKAPKPP